ncbi:EscU/YscU/HrcU family type III secretion system export apparatus switch protein [Agromyces mediolanus]|uniref:EscU/YscU/HrcU family type III secretion system export apparatus switch protein n=1 Tax=Agromyces mediolanus TaxID=41986 RepID=UPI00203E8CEB|nr:EscU/YscU/HrcU family type III secretion system export apparatus switch protein [Agromyces mediolanus]MCM3657512.1 EscU/YscU/HrcU family type III secretion system export apparatus switch protein [Agromyces mediolanus]
MSDVGERSEQATDKRMREVRREGKLQRSQDLTAWVGIGAIAVVLPATIAVGTDAAVAQFHLVAEVAAAPSGAAATQALEAGFASMLPTLGLAFVVVSLVVLAAAVLQGGVHFRRKFWRFEQFDPVKGVGRVFGFQALWQGAKALAKTAILGIVLWSVVQSLMPILAGAGGLPLTTVLQAASDGVAALVVTAVAVGLVLAALDVLVVRRRNRKHTMMTKKEVRDEAKHTDGDPLVKSQRRSRQLAMSRNRMIASVADASVVVVNPTHVAVALRYEPGRSAPRLVAKGKGHIAARIREEAAAAGVPLVRDVPLARALHAACRLGEEIPVELYQAVAVVLTFVQALRRRGSTAGVHTMTTMTPAGGVG